MWMIHGWKEIGKKKKEYNGPPLLPPSSRSRAYRVVRDPSPSTGDNEWRKTQILHPMKHGNQESKHGVGGRTLFSFFG